MSKSIIGRKVKIVTGLFYSPSLARKDLEGTIHSVGEGETSALVNVLDSGGCLMPCFLNEVRYLNNRKVVL